MARLLFATRALADLAEIAAFIETQSGKTSAGRVLASIRRTCRYLKDMPAAGRLRPDLATDLRSFVSVDYGYVVLYRTRTGIVEVIAVIHEARDIGTAMERRRSKS